MKMKRLISIASALFMVLAMLPSMVFASEAPTDTWDNHVAEAFAGGSGTMADPYLIESAGQLAYLAKIANTIGGSGTDGVHYKLTADIDLSEYRWIPIGQSGWNVPDYSGAFKGYFDGNNKNINGLYVDESRTECHSGLFGKVIAPKANEAPIFQNLNINAAVVIGAMSSYEESHAGILCGSFVTLSNSEEATLIKNISVSGYIGRKDGTVIAGGLIGNAQHVTVENCNANVEIDSIDENYNGNAGGMMGMMQNVAANNCVAKGTITGGWTLGGFAGESFDSAIKNCIADVDIAGYDWRIGGFIGFPTDSTISNCASYGDVESFVTEFQPKAGGFVGENASGNTISDCFATGTVSSKHETIAAGGFVGFDNGGTVTGSGFDSTKNQQLSEVGETDKSGTNEISKMTTENINNAVRDSVTNTAAASYAAVDAAIEKIPADLSGYTDETVKALNDAKDAVVSDKDITEQGIVDGYAKAIESAIEALEEKQADPPETGDSNMVLWVSMLLVSGGILTSLAMSKKRRQTAE